MIVSVTCRHGAVKDLRIYVIGGLRGIAKQTSDASRIEVIFEPEHRADKESEYICHLSLFRGHRAPLHLESQGSDAFMAFDNTIDCLSSRMYKEQCSRRRSRTRRFDFDDWRAGA